MAVSIIADIHHNNVLVYAVTSGYVRTNWSGNPICFFWQFSHKS